VKLLMICKRAIIFVVVWTLCFTGSLTSPNVILANQSPSDIQLSNQIVQENAGANATVGTLSAIDADGTGSYTFALVIGLGSDDNSFFNISGNLLRANNSLNYEAKSEYSIRIRVSEGRLTFEKVFSIQVSDINETPNDLLLSTTSFAENQQANAVVGKLSALDPDTISTFRYSFVNGLGDFDNQLFLIDEDQLLATTSLNYEERSNYMIRLQVTDGALTYEEVFTIEVTDVNEAPTDIVLTNHTLAENLEPFQIVGQLSAEDEDVNSQLTFTLLPIADSEDHQQFIIENNQLLSKQSFDFEEKSRYEIRIEVSDGQLSYQESFIIEVLDVNEAPYDIQLDPAQILESATPGTVIGNLNASDPDNHQQFEYMFIRTEDAVRYEISGNQLLTKELLDYEEKSLDTVQIRVTDGQFTYDETFEIEIMNVNEAPVDLQIDNLTIAEHALPGTMIGRIDVTDPDLDDEITFDLIEEDIDENIKSWFVIEGNQLKISGNLDFETKSSWTIHIQARDRDGLKYLEQFQVSVLNVNEAPGSLQLSNNQVDENMPSGSIVGTLDAFDVDAGSELRFRFVDGEGDTNNTDFIIDDATLKTAKVFDYEQSKTRNVRIQVSDGELSFEQSYEIAINDRNDAPHTLILSQATLSEERLEQVKVGTFSAQDDDQQPLTYRLVSGQGSNDNALFVVQENRLLAIAPFDYEKQKTANIRVQVSDGESVFERSFTISIVNVNEAPFGLELNNSAVQENAGNSAVVGTLSAEDYDADATLQYQFVVDAANLDHQLFMIRNNQLLAKSSFDFERRNQYQVKIQVTDGTFVQERTFKISVNNINEAPNQLQISNSTIEEFVPVNTEIGTFTARDPDGTNTFSYTLDRTGNDHSSFTIRGDRLLTRQVLDTTKKSVFNLRIIVADPAGLRFVKNIPIKVITRPLQMMPYLGVYAGNMFKPDWALTRAEVASMVLKLIESADYRLQPTNPKITYKDVTSKSRHFQLVSAITKYDVMAGYPDGTFRPDELIIHREMRTIIVNYLSLMYKQHSGKTNNIFCKTCRTDFHLKEIRKYIDGKQMSNAPRLFKWEQKVSRAEAVVLLNRVFHRGPIVNVSKSSWRDVPATHWAMRDIEAATLTRISKRHLNDHEWLIKRIQ
jgi:hypothetical protein